MRTTKLVLFFGLLAYACGHPVNDKNDVIAPIPALPAVAAVIPKEASSEVTTNAPVDDETTTVEPAAEEKAEPAAEVDSSARKDRQGKTTADETVEKKVAEPTVKAAAEPAVEAAALEKIEQREDETTTAATSEAETEKPEESGNNNISCELVKRML